MQGVSERLVEMASGLGWSWDWIDVGWWGVSEGTEANVCIKGKQKLAPVGYYVARGPRCIT